MSTTVDRKVVEMQFNNSNFESNVKTSMSTLEKLKNALNFSGSTKGLEDLNSAVENVNMSGLGSAVQTVQAKFSALEVVAVSALATITSQAVQAGEQLVASLTVDQIAAGWEKFASKTTSVGTLISQGYDIDTVTEQLERLNWYTDETSYNFTDMVANIAKFTASGQDLETSVTAMEGIANWAALSGQNATTASNAMYQLAQAMSAGYMRLEDYKSIQNASMDTEEFRQKCIDAAVALGTLQDNADGTYTSIVDGATSSTFTLSSFTTSLTKGAWLTSDVMMDVFNDYSNAVDQIYEYAEEHGITASQAIEELGDTVDEFGLKAFKAAQEARTWADVVDSVKDAASTAWMNIFELFIGNYEQATALYTSLANTFYDIFVGPLNNWYDVLSEVMTDMGGRDVLLEGLTNAGTALLDVFNAIGKAWREVFPAATADQIYNIISRFRDLTSSLVDNEEALDKIQRTFKGLFSVLSLIKTIISSVVNAGFRVLQSVLGECNIGILDITASVGDAISGFVEWINENDRLTTAIESGADALINGIHLIKEYVSAFLALPEVQAVVEKFEAKLRELKEVGENAIEGLKEGLEDGKTSIPEILIEIGKSIIQAIKDVLGIHSPSTEMYDVASNAVEGLKNGFTDGTSGIIETVKTLASKLLGAVQEIDWNTIFAGGVSVALLAMVKELTDAFDALSAPAEGLGETLSGVGSVLSGFGKILSKSAGSINKVIKNAAKVVKAFANVLNSYSFSMKAEGIRDIAIALGILVAAVVVLTQLDMDKLQSAVLIVVELAAVLAVLALAMSAIGGSSTSIGASGIQIESSVPKLLGIAASLLVLAGVVKIMGSMDPEEMEQGFIGLAGAVTALVAVVAAYGLLVKADASGNINKVGTMMLAMSVSLLLMIAVVKIAGGLSTEEIEKGIVFMAAFTVFFAAVMAVTNIGSDQKVAKVGTLMLSLSASLLILVAVAKLAGGLTVEEIEKGLVFMTAFTVFLAAVVAVTKISSDQQIAKVGTMMLSLSASLLLLVAASKLAGSLSVDEIEKGVAFMAVFAVFLAAVVSITKIGTEEQLAKVGLTMLALSASIGILAGVAVLLGLIKTENLVKGVTAVGVLGTIMTLMMNFSKYTTSNTASVIALAASIAVLAVAAAALSFIDTTKLAGASVALSALMGMFALILKASSTVTSSLSTLIVMVVAVALLAVVLTAVASLPIDASLSASLSLSAMMLAFAAAMKIISNAHSMSASALVAVGVMALVLAELAVILYMLQDLPVDTTIAVAASLSVLLLSLSAACLILSAVGATGAAAYVGVGALLTLVTALGALMAGIGALCTYFPQLEEFMNKGLSILETIGYGLGSFFGNIVGGFLAGVTDGLPEIGGNLAAFMENAEPFFTGIQNVNADALSGVKALAETILILTKAEILNGLTSWFTGGSSIVSFGEELAEFGPYFNEYYQSIKDVDSDVVEGSANAAKTLAEFASELPNQGGVVSWFTGENSLTAFAEELVVFGPLLKQYADSVEGLNAEVVEDSANAAKSIAEMAAELPNQGGVVGWFTGENSLSTFAEELVVFGPLLKQYADSVDGLDAGVVENSVSAAEALSGMAENLPNQGGVVSWFTGDNSLSVFGEELAKFGPYLADYADSVDGVDADVVTASANAAATLAAFADGLPNSGGLVSLFTGDNGIAKFGEKLVSFGESFAQYYQSVSGVNVSTLSSVTDEFGKLVDLVSGMSGLDTSVMSGFSQGLISLGNTSIDSFVQTFTNANSRVTEAANSLMTAFIAGVNAQKTNVTQSFTTLLQSVLTTLQSSVSQFQTVGSQMMTNFITGIKSQDNTARSTITTIITGCLTVLKNKYSEFQSVGSLTMTRFIAGVKAQDNSTRSSYSNIISACLTIIKNKYSEFQSVGSQTMTKFIAGVKAQDSSATSAYSNIISSCLTILKNKYSEFQSAGQQSMSYFANGISAGSGSATAAAASAASAAASSLNSYYNSFYSAGAYLVQGFANGISANTYLAQAQASAMASAAAASANAALGIHSPSKVGQQIGDYFGQGFINGIAGTVDSVYSASAEMANSASSGLTNAISKIAETIDNGIDTEPTIRPVLDLSNVEEGVGTIGALFSRSQALAVSATMSSTSGAEIQNGDSSKIASGGNTFQFYQTNNSPKALSRTEIYRQTKNQFSALERRMNA